jgi:hypothetical protein
MHEGGEDSPEGRGEGDEGHPQDEGGADERGRRTGTEDEHRSRILEPA